MREPQARIVNITGNLRADLDWQSANLGSIAYRFWSKVVRARDGECWLWTASVLGAYKYGQFTLRHAGKQHHVYAHRMAYALTFGRIPDGQYVCHHCDVPLCVNPNHLFLGSQADNLQDAKAKGRLPKSRRHGLKLDWPQVVSVRQLHAVSVPMTALAAQFDVSVSCISQIVRGKRRTVPPPNDSAVGRQAS